MTKISGYLFKVIEEKINRFWKVGEEIIVRAKHPEMKSD